MIFSALFFYYFILLFFFLERYWSTVRLRQNVNTDTMGLLERQGQHSVLLVFYFSIVIPENPCKKPSVFPLFMEFCHYSHTCLFLVSYKYFFSYCVFWYWTKYNTWFVWQKTETWDPSHSIPGYLEKAFTNCPLDTTLPVLSADFLTPQGTCAFHSCSGQQSMLV